MVEGFYKPSTLGIFIANNLLSGSNGKVSFSYSFFLSRLYKVMQCQQSFSHIFESAYKLIFLSKLSYSRLFKDNHNTVYYTEKHMEPSTLKSCKKLKQKMASLTWIRCIVQLMGVKVK